MFSMITDSRRGVSDERHTLFVVGETALALGVEAAPDFFFLILMPGTGAELRASRKPVHSMAAARRQQTGVRSQQLHYSDDKPQAVLTLRRDDFDFDFFDRVGWGVERLVLLLQMWSLQGTRTGG